MTYDRVACPLCDGQKFDPLGVDPPAPEGRWAPPPALRCRQCGLGVETHLAFPTGGYATETYDKARNHGVGTDRWARFHHDAAVAGDRFAQLEPYLPPVRKAATPPLWVDLGCGNAAFLATARRRGWRVLGVEADGAAAHEIANRLGLPAMTFEAWSAAAQGAKPEAGACPAAISGYDFFEHLLDPVDAFKTAFGALEVGGVLVVEVPDLDAAGADFATWRHRRVTQGFTEHVTHWCGQAFDRLVHRHLFGGRIEHSGAPVPGKLQVVIRKRG